MEGRKISRSPSNNRKVFLPVTVLAGAFERVMQTEPYCGKWWKLEDVVYILTHEYGLPAREEEDTKQQQDPSYIPISISPETLSTSLRNRFAKLFDSDEGHVCGGGNVRIYRKTREEEEETAVAEKASVATAKATAEAVSPPPQADEGEKGGATATSEKASPAVAEKAPAATAEASPPRADEDKDKATSTASATTKTTTTKRTVQCYYVSNSGKSWRDDEDGGAEDESGKSENNDKKQRPWYENIQKTTPDLSTCHCSVLQTEKDILRLALSDAEKNSRIINSIADSKKKAATASGNHNQQQQHPMMVPTHMPHGHFHPHMPYYGATAAGAPPHHPHGTYPGQFAMPAAMGYMGRPLAIPKRPSPPKRKKPPPTAVVAAAVAAAAAKTKKPLSKGAAIAAGLAANRHFATSQAAAATCRTTTTTAADANKKESKPHRHWYKGLDPHKVSERTVYKHADSMWQLLHSKAGGNATNAQIILQKFFSQALAQVDFVPRSYMPVDGATRNVEGCITDGIKNFYSYFNSGRPGIIQSEDTQAAINAVLTAACFSIGSDEHKDVSMTQISSRLDISQPTISRNRKRGGELREHNKKIDQANAAAAAAAGDDGDDAPKDAAAAEESGDKSNSNGKNKKKHMERRLYLPRKRQRRSDCYREESKACVLEFCHSDEFSKIELRHAGGKTPRKVYKMKDEDGKVEMHTSRVWLETMNGGQRFKQFQESKIYLDFRQKHGEKKTIGRTVFRDSVCKCVRNPKLAATGAAARNGNNDDDSSSDEEEDHAHYYHATRC